jgi:hypothetical protein
MKNLLFSGAAALLVAVWAAAVQTSDYSSSDSQDNPPLLPMVTALDANHTGISEGAAPRKGGRALSLTAYQHYRQHIDKNIQRLTSLRQIAMECHLSIAGVSRMFQIYGHQNVDRYLLRLKKNQAPGPLRQLTQPITSQQNTPWPDLYLAGR